VARVIHEHSAGGVVLIPVGRQNDGQVLALPKGHIEPGETSAVTAVREVWEETGMRTRVRADLGTIQYWFYSRRQHARISKRVDFFLLDYRSGSPRNFNDEVDGVRYVPLSKARGVLSYDGERDVLGRAEAYLRGR
jgi:8-oxo-dGTP pyrophosphatase MutT (NUDIX family)